MNGNFEDRTMIDLKNQLKAKKQEYQNILNDLQELKEMYRESNWPKFRVEIAELKSMKKVCVVELNKLSSDFRDYQNRFS